MLISSKNRLLHMQITADSMGVYTKVFSLSLYQNFDVIRQWSVQWCLMAGPACLVSDYRFVIFGTLKDNSLQINSLASINCFSNRNGWRQCFINIIKMVYKTRVFLFACLLCFVLFCFVLFCFVFFFCQKAQISCSLSCTILFKFHGMLYKMY